MTGGIFGGGVIFVVAALLWTAVLVPSWIRRREFKEAERHAIRLQRTLRVLAETAEIPNEIRVEATAREALAQEKILRSARRQRDAEQAAAVAVAEAEQVRAEIRAQQMKRKQASMTRAQKLRRPVVRRVRAIAALLTLLGLLSMLVGLGTAIAGQGFGVFWVSFAVFAAASGTLVLLAPGRAKAKPSVALPQAEALLVELPAREAVEPVVEEIEEVVDQQRAHAEAQAAARERIERARALTRARAQIVAQQPKLNQPESILLTDAEPERDAVAKPETTTVEAPAAAARVSEETLGSDTAAETETAVPAAKNRFQDMGVVGDTSTGMLDLDAVMRSRRQAG